MMRGGSDIGDVDHDLTGKLMLNPNVPVFYIGHAGAIRLHVVGRTAVGEGWIEVWSLLHGWKSNGPVESGRDATSGTGNGCLGEIALLVQEDSRSRIGVIH